MSLDSNDLSPKAGLYLHAGMPKTATTSLQKFLFAEHPQISYLGKNIHKKGPAYPNKSIQKLIKLTRGTQAFFTQEELHEIRELSESARREGRSLVLSEELLVSGKLSNKRETARIFQQHFADCRIVLVLREPLEFVESLYFQYLKGFNLQNLCYKILKDEFGEPPQLFGINQWLDAMWDHPREPVREYLRYADNLETYASAFGRENVIVLSFSKLKSDFDAFTTDLSHAFDIDVEITRDLLRGRHVNDRWTCAMIERLKSIQSSRLSRWKYLKWSNGRQRRKMLGLAGSKDARNSPKARAAFSEEWKSEIEQFAASQIGKLITDWNISADEMGWAEERNWDRAPTCRNRIIPRRERNSSASKPSRKSLWKKARRSNTWEDCFVSLASRIPYEWGNFLLSHLFSSSQLQSRLFHETVEKLRTIETWIGRPIELKQAVCRHLFANAGKEWRMLAFGDMRWPRAKKSFTIGGQEIVERYRGRQPGVIMVNSHFGAARDAGKVLYENGFPLTVIAEADNAALYSNVECNSLLTHELSPFQVIREASRELDAGRVLYISADGSRGDAGIELNFLGKRRPFRTGFAQLAIKTGAPVVPVFGTVNERGFVHIQIHDPLDCGLSTQPKRDRIAFLVEQYARLLEGYWIADPGNIREEQFLSHQYDYGIHTARTIAREIQSRAA